MFFELHTAMSYRPCHLQLDFKIARDPPDAVLAMMSEDNFSQVR